MTATATSLQQPRAKKALGQHFLRNKNICSNIAKLIDCTTDDHIIEIGPGPGALTLQIESLPHATLVLVEKDFFWANERQRLCEGEKSQTILMDALQFDWTRIQRNIQWKIVGNLPYNIASPLIWEIVAHARFCKAVFMVQKEVGQRLVASPGTKQYGALTVWVQNFTRPRLCFCVPPAAFSPPPAVDSAVLTFEPEQDLPAHPQALARLLHICFQQRRKQIGNILRNAAISNAGLALEKCTVPTNVRPEEIEPRLFRKLSETLFIANIKNT